MYRVEYVQRRHNLGKFPKMNAATARTKAGTWLEKVHNGFDPAGERAIAKKAEAVKFDKMVGLYVDRQRDEKTVRASTLSQVELYLRGPYFAPLHNKPFAKITRSDVALCLAEIKKDSSRLAAHKQGSALYVWAMKNGHAPENPFAQIERVKAGKKRDRVLKDAELRTVWNALRDDDLGNIVKLLLLTGCRAAEIGSLRWSEIDTEAGTITLPPERTKNGCTHRIPLSSLALDIIRNVTDAISFSASSATALPIGPGSRTNWSTRLGWTTGRFTTCGERQRRTCASLEPPRISSKRSLTTPAATRRAWRAFTTGQNTPRKYGWRWTGGLVISNASRPARRARWWRFRSRPDCAATRLSIALIPRV
jgi:site-specific recombinase XerC